MSGERTFLYSLLKGDYRLSKKAQEAIWGRLEAIELSPQPLRPPMPAVAANGVYQAPSTLRNMEAHPPPYIAPEPVEQVAQTPAAQAALASRQQAIAESMAGKVDKTTGRPRKF